MMELSYKIFKNVIFMLFLVIDNSFDICFKLHYFFSNFLLLFMDFHNHDYLIHIFIHFKYYYFLNHL